MNDAKLNIRLPAELLASLEAEAKRQDRSLAWVIRAASKQYLESKKEKQ